jgi:hypothetical protein
MESRRMSRDVKVARAVASTSGSAMAIVAGQLEDHYGSHHGRVRRRGRRGGHADQRVTTGRTELEPQRR